MCKNAENNRPHGYVVLRTSGEQAQATLEGIGLRSACNKRTFDTVS